MKLRESPSDALLDEIIGSDRIARKTSRVPSKVKQVGFDVPAQYGLRSPGLFIEGGRVTGDRWYRRLPAWHFFIAPHCEPQKRI
jgi:hypothetical protein